MVSSLEMYKLNNQNRESGLKYHKVTRGSERSKLKGYECPECKAFFQALGDNNMRELWSRHRCQHKPLGPPSDITRLN